MSKKKSSHKKKKGIFRKNYIATIVIILLLAGGIYYIKEIEDKERYEISLNGGNNEYYKVLENQDTTRYIVNIELSQHNTNILDLSEIFYSNKIFWPYIFQANKKIENPLDMPKGTVLLIPKVDSVLLDINSPETVSRVKSLGNSILEEVNEKRRPRVFD